MSHRKIIHIDMDAFYASVEQRDHSELRGKPVIVGGSPNSRGVVATASYEARKYGVHSAMASSRAHRLCPDGIFIRPRFDVYKEVSKQIRSIFFEFTDLVEPLSLDEAYLDVTDSLKPLSSATLIAKEIKDRIRRETGLTASAGVAFNKFLAKVASDLHKPDGLTVITPENADAFIKQLPIRKFHGIGRVTEQKMERLGIRTGADLKQWTERGLVREFGKAGSYYFNICHGIDHRKVKPHRLSKSIGAENTFAEDHDDFQWLSAYLEELAGVVASRLKKAGTGGRTITLKVTYANFEKSTRSLTLPESIRDPDIITKHTRQLLTETEAGDRKIRLLGITVSNLDLQQGRESGRQLDLFNGTVTV